MRENDTYGIQRGWCEVERLVDRMLRKEGLPPVKRSQPSEGLPSGSLSEEDFERVVWSTLKEPTSEGEGG